MKKFLWMFVFSFLVFISFMGIGLAQEASEVAKPTVADLVVKWVEIVLQLFGGLAVIATTVVRVIPGKKDDEKVFKIVDRVHKYAGYLPTFGVNPRTKELEAALAELRKQAEEIK